MGGVEGGDVVVDSVLLDCGMAKLVVDSQIHSELIDVTKVVTVS